MEAEKNNEQVESIKILSWWQQRFYFDPSSCFFQFCA